MHDPWVPPPDPFEALVDDAIEAIPPPFSEQLGSVAIVVEDEPRPEQVPPGQILFGLYSGVPRTTWGADNVPVPSKITIYRGPHLRMYRDPDRLAREVENTVFHEVAHHFGISDVRLHELRRGAGQR